MDVNKSGFLWNGIVYFLYLCFEMKLTFAVLFAFFVALAYSESCACVAEEEDFTINCNQDLTSYFEYLEDNNCQDDCDQNCQRNFYIVQSHHDYCLSDEVPIINFNFNFICLIKGFFFRFQLK